MNRKERRRQEKAARKGGGTAKPGTAAASRPNVASALMGYASGGSAAPLATGTQDPENIIRFAVSMFQSGRLKEAERAFRDVLNLEPNNAPALQLLGVTLHQMGSSDKGIGLIQRALSIDPNYAEAHNNLGLIFVERGMMDEARDSFETAVESDPDYADGHLNLSNLLIADGQLDEAREALERAVDLQPDNIRALSNLSALELQTGRETAALAVIEKALDAAPDNVLLHNNRGSIQLMLGDTAAARDSLQRALELDPNNKEARDNLRELNSRAIQHWHFPMLADDTRNDAFDAAIQRLVGPGDRVLDIGTGSGLLAMMAARAGAEHVWAVEMIPELADAAGRIVADNGFSEKITILGRNSMTLDVEEDLDGEVDVIISEILDAGLLGEGVIPTLRHAVANLGRPGAKVLPAAATVTGALMELPERARYSPLGEISRFDLSRMNEFRNPAAYRSVQLNHETHRQLSEPFHVVTFEFADLPTTERNRRVEIPITESGTAHAVVFWFDLHLDAETTVSTGPDGALQHWDQALQFFENGPDVTAGDRLPLLIGHTDKRIYFEL